MTEASVVADTPLPRSLELTSALPRGAKPWKTVARIPEFTALTPTSLNKAGGPLDRLMTCL